ncbi:phosphohydrolase [Pollutimonas bauzanensis]|uniref:Phosphohydrolase n=1 Tax=Pollutimonas bauzanensis TaxID=658167 RepID=A0A1M5YIT5_9BURK|nr:phosphohydrolase [Pollutimonas bauzanensis]SHI11930.1 hypothetical protein SAMN04488135_109135 [Pollutimonas bauzanensis]
MKATEEHTKVRAWMRLPSGKRLDLMNPDPHDWEHSDLSVRLSRTYRWGGESCWPWPLSVAQHSLLVLELRRQKSTEPLHAVEELRELLHDAEEAFLGFDCISPLKQALGEPFKIIEHGLVNAIWQRYQLPAWSGPAYIFHKEADHVAAACEAVHCVGWKRREVVDVLGIMAPVLDQDPLVSRYRGPHWSPWPADVAEARYHDELMRLCRSLNME